MQPVNRTVPDDGYVLCYDCGGVGICTNCDGEAKVDGRLCGVCSGRRYCLFCRGGGQVRPQYFPGSTRGPLIARSAGECRLYIALHPHDCGERSFPAHSRVEKTEQGLVAVYEAECPRCQKVRRVEFLLDPELPPPPPAYGGAKASAIIDPGEFLHVADEAAKRAPSAAIGLSLEQVERAREQLAVAAAALEEVLKFIPPDKTAPPASAFRSEIGTEVFRKEPGRFERPRLQAVLDTYRKGLDEYRLAIAKLKAPLTDDDRELAAKWRADREKRMQKQATEGRPPRKLPPDSPIFKKWDSDPFPGGLDSDAAPPGASSGSDTAARDDRPEIEFFLERLTNGDARDRVLALNALAGRPRADERLLAACERLLDDRAITVLGIPYEFGEVRWVAADAVASMRGLMGRTDAVVVEDVFAPVSARNVEQLAIEAGVAPSTRGGIEGDIETLERAAAAGKLPRRRIKREPLVPSRS